MDSICKNGILTSGLVCLYMHTRVYLYIRVGLFQCSHHVVHVDIFHVYTRNSFLKNHMQTRALKHVCIHTQINEYTHLEASSHFRPAKIHAHRAHTR